jgi:hypothetical protein
MSVVVNLGALGTGGFVIQGDNPQDSAGFSVSNAGDMNGDGFDDIIIGAPNNDSAGTDDGAAYVIYGRAGGLGDIDLSNLSPTDGFKIQGQAAGFVGSDETGLSVSSAGDINGDGFADIMVASARTGAFGYGDGPRAYVIFGGPTRSTTLDLSHMTSSDGFQINAPFEYSYSKSVHVSSAGDINGDGFDDMLIGLPFESLYGANEAGVTYVVFGKADGFGTINLGNSATTDYFAVTGANAGSSVSSLGDINNDGFDDFIIGAPYNDSAGTDAGAAYVIFGHGGSFSNIDLTNLAPSAGFVIEGDAAGDSAGFSVSGAGDVNGDGFADIIVGSIDGGTDNQGAAYVIFGKADGFGTIDLTNLPASAGFVIQGAATGDLAGRSVSAAGDVNHDGFADLIVGAPSNDANGADSGRAYVIFGHPGIGSIDLADLVPVAGFIIQGASPAGFAGWTVSGAGDINGDGFADLVTGDPFADLGGTASGAAYVIYGAAAPSPDLPHNDFNGDGRSDILWRNSSTGQIVDWLATSSSGFNGNGPNSSHFVSADWQVAGTGDFNGDGRVDILWRNTDGRISDWLGTANGDFVGNGAHSIAAVSNSWQVAATGDFNGDGREDILWRNPTTGQIADWLANANGNGGFTGNGAHSAASIDPVWQVAGTGDFNGDGIDDILWRNSSTGRIADWLGKPDASGGFTGNGANSGNTVDLAWQVAGIGDFNGDGHSDILWRNSSTGQVNDWLGTATGGFTDNSAHASATLSTAWQVAEIGDFNGDGIDDILWRNTSTGQTTDWLGHANGDGGFIDNSAHAAATVDLHWQVQPTAHLV